jgi:hypothetical protein
MAENDSNNLAVDIDNNSGIALREKLLKQAKQKINGIRNLIFLLAAFQVYDIYNYFDFAGVTFNTFIIIQMIIALLYLFFGLFMHRNPKSVVLYSGILYIVVNASYMLFNASIINYLYLIKLLIIYYFFRAYKAALELETLELNISKIKQEDILDSI